PGPAPTATGGGGRRGGRRGCAGRGVLGGFFARGCGPSGGGGLGGALAGLLRRLRGLPGGRGLLGLFGLGGLLGARGALLRGAFLSGRGRGAFGAAAAVRAVRALRVVRLTVVPRRAGCIIGHGGVLLDERALGTGVVPGPPGAGGGLPERGRADHSAVRRGRPRGRRGGGEADPTRWMRLNVRGGRPNSGTPPGNPRGNSPGARRRAPGRPRSGPACVEPVDEIDQRRGDHDLHDQSERPESREQRGDPPADERRDDAQQQGEPDGDVLLAGDDQPAERTDDQADHDRADDAGDSHGIPLRRVISLRGILSGRAADDVIYVRFYRCWTSGTPHIDLSTGRG